MSRFIRDGVVKYNSIQNIKITLIQSNIIWENAVANLKKYSEMISGIESTDVIILPEMFSTGFSMQPEKLKETMDGSSVEWMRKVAREMDAAIVGSLIIEENNQIFNRALWVFPDGKIEKYDKRHLFTMAEEQQYYSSGNDRLIIKYKGWKFCPLVCYDLRFPVWSRNTENYDVLIYVANWPAPRHHVWRNLIVARAIENQSYCFGVNRTGADDTGLKYLGDSVSVSPKGFVDFLGEKEAFQTFEISYSRLHIFRKNFPLLEDRDEFQIT